MIRATNTVGAYGVPGFGTFPPKATLPVPLHIAAYLRTRPEFIVHYDEDGAQFRDEDGRIRWIGYWGPVDSRFGYGSGGINILRALKHLGITANVSVEYDPAYRTAYPVDLHPDAAFHLKAGQAVFPKWAIMHSLPDSFHRCHAPRRVAFTMWESDKIPDGTKTKLPFGDWAKQINESAEHLLVPCKHNAEVFAECGVTVPITVVGYPVEVEPWPLIKRPERDTFTVVLFGDLTHRKGPREAVIAFQMAFPHEKDVRLILKSQHLHFGGVGMPIIKDPRIKLINDTWNRAQLLDFLAQADCFIWPSRGEGWGLPPLQAALTGLPVLTTVHTGAEEWFDPRYFYKIETAGKSPSPLYGNWLDPDVDSAAAMLRHVYENRKEAKRKGELASRYVRRNLNVGKFAKRLGEFLDTLE